MLSQPWSAWPRFIEPGVHGHVTVQIAAMRGKYAVLRQIMFGSEREVLVEIEKLEAA